MTGWIIAFVLYLLGAIPVHAYLTEITPRYWDRNVYLVRFWTCFWPVLSLIFFGMLAYETIRGKSI